MTMPDIRRYQRKHIAAIIAVVQALRVNPDKYNIIFDNSEYDNSSEYHKGLLEVAKSFLKIMLDQMVDNTMVAAIKADVK